MKSGLTIHPKVVGSGAGGGLAIVVLFVLGLLHVHVDPEGVAGITTVVALIGGWLAPIAKAERDRIVAQPQAPLLLGDPAATPTTDAITLSKPDPSTPPAPKPPAKRPARPKKPR